MSDSVSRIFLCFYLSRKMGQLGDGKQNNFYGVGFLRQGYNVFCRMPNAKRQLKCTVCLWFTYMPTLPDYPGVSRIRNKSPGLPYGSPNLLDKKWLWTFQRPCSAKAEIISINWYNFGFFNLFHRFLMHVFAPLTFNHTSNIGHITECLIGYLFKQ